LRRPLGSDRKARKLGGFHLIVHEISKFNLPTSLVEAIPQIGDHDTAVLMHNDGVAQGLSEVPFMQDVDHWGVLTIGTGPGNARFTNRKKSKGKDEKKEKKSKD
jgi:hypothetical protein